MYRFLLTAASALVLALQSEAPDLVILNARVFTGVDERPWAEAVAVRGWNIFDVPAEAFPKAVSVLTVVNGRVVHETLSAGGPRDRGV